VLAHALAAALERALQLIDLAALAALGLAETDSGQGQMIAAPEIG